RWRVARRVWGRAARPLPAPLRESGAGRAAGGRAERVARRAGRRLRDLLGGAGRALAGGGRGGPGARHGEEKENGAGRRRLEEAAQDLRRRISVASWSFRSPAHCPVLPRRRSSRRPLTRLLANARGRPGTKSSSTR